MQWPPLFPGPSLALPRDLRLLGTSCSALARTRPPWATAPILAWVGGAPQETLVEGSGCICGIHLTRGLVQSLQDPEGETWYLVDLGCEPRFIPGRQTAAMPIGQGWPACSGSSVGTQRVSVLLPQLPHFQITKLRSKTPPGPWGGDRRRGAPCAVGCLGLLPQDGRQTSVCLRASHRLPGVLARSLALGFHCPTSPVLPCESSWCMGFVIPRQGSGPVTCQAPRDPPVQLGLDLGAPSAPSGRAWAVTGQGGSPCSCPTLRPE